MSCVVEEIPFDPTDFDKALGDLLIGHEGHAQQFLVSIFSFLKRKTNFFKEADAKRRILEAMRQVAPEAAGADGFKGGFFGAPKAAAAKQQVCSRGAGRCKPNKGRLKNEIISKLFRSKHDCMLHVCLCCA